MNNTNVHTSMHKI